MQILHSILSVDELQTHGPYWWSQPASNFRFTFPDTLGALFFGASLVVFISTIKAIAVSSSTKGRKAISYSTVGLLFILGAIFHAFEANDYSLFVSTWRSEYNDKPEELAMSISVGSDHTHFLVSLSATIALLTSWIAAKLLVLRAYTLLGRDRRVLVVLGGLLGSMIIVEIVLFAIGFLVGAPAYPTVNLLLNLFVTAATLYYYIHVKPIASSEKVCSIRTAADIFADSGMLLTVALLLQTIFMFTGVTFWAVFSLLPHVQNIVSCTLISRMVSEEHDLGVLRLPSDDEVNSTAA